MSSSSLPGHLDASPAASDGTPVTPPRLSGSACAPRKTRVGRESAPCVDTDLGKNKSAGRASHRQSFMGRRRRRSKPSRLPIRVWVWRWRHLLVGLCVAGVVVAVLQTVRPAALAEQSVLVAARPISAGAIIGEDDVTYRELPRSALPEEGLANEQIVGHRSSVSLPSGAIMLESMTFEHGMGDLRQGERLVSVPIGVGAGLASPGARVDVVGTQISRSWGQEDSSSTQEGAQIICSGARILGVETDSSRSKSLWQSTASGSTHVKDVVVTLAVPDDVAANIVWAATRERLSLTLAP